MKRNLLLAVLIGTGVTFSMWGVSSAQNRPVLGGADARVALVDVALIFKKYEKFSRLYEQMKAEVKQREKEIADMQNDLKSLMNQKQQFTPDSPNYKQLEQKIVQKKGELELSADSARREFTQKEANLYHQTYQEVEAAIQNYAERNGITLVLRASRSAEGTSANPQEVIKEVSQMVVYSLPQMDITDAILDMLNPKTVTGPTRTPANKTPVQPLKTTNQNDNVKKPSAGPAKK